MLKEKLFEQAEIYEKLKRGEQSQVQYFEQYDKAHGRHDKNYLNRMRLAYYLLYAHIDDEDAVVYLFREELKDRKSNSFQGIGNTLRVLTSLLNRYNAAGKYDGILDEAKNANFDCFCGFDKSIIIDDEIARLDLADCMFLAHTLDYKDVMEVLVEQWKNGISVWTDADRRALIGFNSYLGRDAENEGIYEVLLENALATGKVFEVVSAYNKLIRYYIDGGKIETARSRIMGMIAGTDFKEIERIRLFDDVLEECFDLICGGCAEPLELWEWAKPRLPERRNMYGNLYTKGIAAAKLVGDPFGEDLEREYEEWKRKVGLSE